MHVFCDFAPVFCRDAIWRPCCSAGAGKSCVTSVADSNIQFNNPNQDWKAFNLPKRRGDQPDAEGFDSNDEADDHWLEAAEAARRELQ